MKKEQAKQKKKRELVAVEKTPTQPKRHLFLISPDGDTCAICGVLPDEHPDVENPLYTSKANLGEETKAIMSKALAGDVDNELVALEDVPRSQVHFGMKPQAPESTTKSEGEQPEKTEPPSKVKYVEPDERFRKKEKEPDHKRIKRSMEKEQAKDKRINMLARAKRYWTSDVEAEGWTFPSTVRIFSIVVAYLLNLFTVCVIVYLVVDVVMLLRGDLINYYQAIKIVLTGAFIWMVVKIHEKVEV